MIWEQMGARMRWETYGSGERKLLLLHGWGCTLEVFAPIIRDLQDRITLYAVEFPGHGQSSEPPCPWEVTEYARMLISLLDGEGIGKCDVLAHSFGGRVALWMGANRPDLIGKLIITGGAGIPPKNSGKVSAKSRVYKMLRTLTKLLPHKAGDNAREALVQKFGSADYRVLTPSMRETFKRVIRQDLTDTLTQIQSPTLLYWGETDTATPLWMGKMMEEKIPDAGLVTEPGVGHYAFLERYGRFRAVLENFLEV